MKVHTGKVDVTPQDAGYNPENLNILDNFFLESIETTPLQAASYLLSKNGNVFAWKSMGKLSAFKDKGDFLPDSIYRVASITKVFTATGIMQLVEQGKLVLEQPVHTLIDEFKTKIHETINIFHLLTHTSGLSADPGGYLEPYPQPWGREDIDCTNWIKAALEGPLQYKVGEVWNYCSRGFSILAEIIARVSGMPYDEYIQKHVLEPLEMTRSFFEAPEALKDQVCVVTEWGRKILNEKRDEKFTPSWLGGGGLYSTPHDLWKFGQMMLNKGTFRGKRILGKKTVEAMTRNHLKDVPAYNWDRCLKAKSYGLGWEINRDTFLPPGTFDHEGAGWSSLFIDPIEQFVSIYMEPAPGDFWEHRVMLAPRAIIWSGIL